MSTIDYYDQNAQEYYERTVDADLAEIRGVFSGILAKRCQDPGFRVRQRA